MGSRLGISTEKIEALNDYAKSPLFSDAEKVALEYADAITDTRRDVEDELFARSEERRVGKECHVVCRSRWSPYH